MSAVVTERYKLTALGWLTTVAMSLCFFPALGEKRFFWLGALVAAATLIVGAALRLLRVPALIVFVIQLAALAEMILLGYGRHAKYGVIPTGRTLDTIEDLVRSGTDVAQAYAAPTPASVGLTMMVVFFIALIATTVDLAIWIGRVPLAGLPLLALYTVPVAALPDGVPVYGFLPGAVGYLALIMLDERDRLAHWGRLVARHTAPEQKGAIDTSGLGATGRRISLLALAIAVVVPIFVPSFAGSLLDRGGSGGGSGIGITFEDPMVSLATSLRRNEPVDLLTVESDASPEYLRMVALDQPGPDAWTARTVNISDTIPADNVLPAPTGLSSEVAQQSRAMRISQTASFPNDTPWLPVPFNIETVGIGPEWAYVVPDQTVTVTDPDALNTLRSYSVSYAELSPTAAQIEGAPLAPDSIADRYTTVPEGVPSVVATTAELVTSGAANDYQRAVLLQDFFRDPDEFTYDLDAGYGYGFQSMVDFLDERRGFCQQFAATMAMMARMQDIPSRVVVGFLQPERLNKAGEHVFTSYSLHSWPELYFEGVGWVRFEPTPGVGAPLPAYARRPVSTPTIPTGPSESVPTSIRPTGLPTRDPTGSTEAVDPSAGGRGGGRIPSNTVLVTLAVLVLLLLPAALRWGVRRARLSRPLEADEAAEWAWTELRDHIRDLRLPWSGSMTPRARQRMVVPMLDGDAGGLAALSRLTLSVERTRYAQSSLPDAAPATDAREVMSVISRGADRGQRLRALLWPSSLLPDIRTGWATLTSRVRRRPALVDE